MAGILLVLLPTVMIGGISLLSMLLWEPAYAANRCGKISGAPATPTPAFC